MEKIVIKHIKDIPETMLIPLWARAVETSQANPIIEDHKAEEMISQIDYDFSRFNKVWMSQVGCSIRTMLLDRATCDFLNQNKGAVVVNLGCGLDTRSERLKDAGASIWYDLDLPEAIQLRRHFFKESSYNRFIEKSILDFSWIDNIEQNDKPVLIIAEGLLMYFTEDELKPLFNAITNHFNKVEMLFEMLSPLLVGKSKHHDALKKTGGKAEFKWGIRDTKEMERWNNRIRYIEEWNYFDFYRKRWRFLRFPAMIPAFKNNFNNRIVHLKFI
ncbi:MAG: class I SAM-dependent methyltransferase [Mangrovibacterium sp.]